MRVLEKRWKCVVPLKDDQRLLDFLNVSGYLVVTIFQKEINEGATDLVEFYHEGTDGICLRIGRTVGTTANEFTTIDELIEAHLNEEIQS